MSLPEGKSLDQVKERFGCVPEVYRGMCKQFGKECDISISFDIANVERVPGYTGEVIRVTYFDVRAAEIAMTVVGGKKYCTPGPQIGDRSASLKSTFIVDPLESSGVSSAPGDVSGEWYMVEYFDTRHAERDRSLAASAAEESVEAPPGLEKPPGLAPPPGLEQRQPQIKAAPKLKDVTNMPASDREHQAIMIQGIPSMLCDKTMFEVMLEQAGFKTRTKAAPQGSLIRFSTKPGKPCGEATVWLRDVKSAQECVAHFQGREWNKGSGTIVRAWCLDTWESHRKKRCDTGATEASTCCPDEDEYYQDVY
jgi:hypothetical protein